jgi:5-methyltetrahydrofolate--homocysteine methyltransferase
MTQPNAGMPRLVDGKSVFPDTPEMTAGFAERFAQLGVRIIGGCCGTTPEHIRAVAQRVKGMARDSSADSAD